jgi:hypothetical protein
VKVNALKDIVSRAIDHTNSILTMMPSYRRSAISGLRKLRAALAAGTPDDPALASLDAYLESLDKKAARGECVFTRSERLL